VAIGMLLFFKKRGWIGGSSDKQDTPEG